MNILLEKSWMRKESVSINASINSEQNLIWEVTRTYLWHRTKSQLANGFGKIVGVGSSASWIKPAFYFCYQKPPAVDKPPCISYRTRKLNIKGHQKKKFSRYWGEDKSWKVGSHKRKAKDSNIHRFRIKRCLPVETSN